MASWSEFSAQAPELISGDAKLNGRAVEVTDVVTLERFVGALPQPPQTRRQ